MPPAAQPHVAVIGGGINGVMSAWMLARDGNRVDLFERRSLMGETSSASTKLLHGGLRYLEHGSFRLVREALRERAWWISQAPQIAGRLRVILPIWKWSRRPRWIIDIGMRLYSHLAGSASLGPHSWMSSAQLLKIAPHLRNEGLMGGFSFWDGKMDDRALGLWAASRAHAAGVSIQSGRQVDRIKLDGSLIMNGLTQRYDHVVNCAGPWARSLLDRSGIRSRHDLDLVRGSHLVFDRKIEVGVLAEVPDSQRIAFLLPWKSGSLLGTTEVRQKIDEPIICSEKERADLIAFHDSICRVPLHLNEIRSTFAGLRPLVRSADDPSRATREYVLERQGAILTVFGGKWTTARRLGLQVARTLRS